MPKCKFCKQKKEFYSELGYCDECLHEIKAFLKMSKARVQELKEESLTAEPERKKEIGEEAQGLEEALRSYAKRGVPIDKKEYQAQLRAIYAHCGVVRPRKRNLPLTIGAAAVLAAAVGAAVFFGVSWQAQKQAVSELQLQNEQLTMSPGKAKAERTAGPPRRRALPTAASLCQAPLPPRAAPPTG